MTAPVGVLVLPRLGVADVLGVVTRPIMFPRTIGLVTSTTWLPMLLGLVASLAWLPLGPLAVPMVMASPLVVVVVAVVGRLAGDRLVPLALVPPVVAVVGGLRLAWRELRLPLELGGQDARALEPVVRVGVRFGLGGRLRLRRHFRTLRQLGSRLRHGGRLRRGGRLGRGAFKHGLGRLRRRVVRLTRQHDLVAAGISPWLLARRVHVSTA